MNTIIEDINGAYYEAYRECHNRELWDEDQYRIIEDAEREASVAVDKIEAENKKFKKALVLLLNNPDGYETSYARIAEIALEEV